MVHVAASSARSVESRARGGFFLAVLTHGHSGYVEIIILIFYVQSDHDDVIRYCLQFLEIRLYTLFF